jgi:hypothetical protein
MTTFYGEPDALVSNVCSHMTTNLTDYEKGFLLGLLVGEGHFGGDLRQPQITLHMHTRHGPLLRWVCDLLPGGRFYGPYYDGARVSYRVLFRGPYLREVVAPLLQSLPWVEIDPYTYGRFLRMLDRYHMHDTVPKRSTGNEALLNKPKYASLAELLQHHAASRPSKELSASGRDEQSVEYGIG